MQAIDGLQVPRGPQVRSDVGDEDVPAEQEQVFGAGGKFPVEVLTQLAPAHVGDRIGNGNGHQANGQPGLVAQADGLVQNALFPEGFRQRDLTARAGIEHVRGLAATRQEERVSPDDGGEGGKHDEAQFPDDQVARAEHRQDVGLFRKGIATEFAAAR